ncbi:AraC family transcriptional regulator [Paenibacillus chitinolyticus]|uniref:AraC family transcriptional regulator n=1 Tax=Paenibacillus chitinolyticus TaxID=79263 RepID=UPI0026E500FA|nr:AraC family transcriptional regulator [Paenibacillus chitinolyticus]GKS12265.1 AraC family transcriptional regulator [Paenibacillus chitinolyticus]
MPSSIQINTMHDYFDRFSEHMGGQITGSGGERRLLLSPRLGEGTLTRIPIRTGMEIVVSDFELIRDLKVQVHGSYSLFELNYCLEGDIYCAWEGNELQTGSLSGNVFFMENMNVYMEKKGGVRNRTLEIRLHPELLLRCARGPEETEQIRHLLSRSRGRIGRFTDTPLIRQGVRDLLQSGRLGSMRRWYAESKAMELIALISQPEDGVKEASGISLTPDDRNRLSEARRQVLDRLDSPPSIPELARLCGVNEYKLKKGFRTLFGTTVYELVRRERMKRAAEYMDRGMNVSEAAVQLGYANMSNFTAAFRKQFGLNPGQYLKQANQERVRL